MKRALIGIFGQEETVSDFGFFDIGTGKSYFTSAKSGKLKELDAFIAVLEKEHQAKASAFISGPVIEKLSEKQVNSLKKLIEDGRLELLAGPNHQSLACILSFALFKEEIDLHLKVIRDTFHVRPVGFINTAAIFADDLASGLDGLGFEYALVPRVPWFQFSGESGATFNSEGTGMSLLLIGTSSDKTLEVVTEGQFNVKSFSRIHAYFTCSEFIKLKAPKANYRMPSIVASDLDHADFASLVGNSLQIQVFRRLKAMSEHLTKKKALTEETVSTAARLANISHFRALREIHPERHAYYLNLMNCIADFEVQLEL